MLDTLRRLRHYPGNTVAIAGNVAVVGMLAVSVSFFVRVEAWFSLELSPGFGTSGPRLLTDAIDWTSSVRTPAGLRMDELEGLTTLFLVMASAVLVVCTVNLVVLTLRHVSGRGRELAVRRAVGATQARLRRELLTEGGVLLAVGLLFGLLGGGLLSLWGRGHVPELLTPIGGFGPRWDVVGLLVVLPLAVVGFVYGCAGPASRDGLSPLGSNASSIAEKAGTPSAPTGWRRGLAALQIGLLATLLVGSSVLLFEAPTNREAGQGPEAELNLVDTTWSASSRGDDRGQQVATLSRHLAGTAGAGKAGLASSGASLGLGTRDEILCRGCQGGLSMLATPVMSVRPRVSAVGPAWFDTLEVQVLEGRGIRTSDRRESEPVAVVNRAFATHFGVNAGTATLLLPGREYTDPWLRVVGVVENVGVDGLGVSGLTAPTVYLSAFQFPPEHLTVAFQSVASRRRVVEDALSGIRALKPGRPESFEKRVAEHRAPERAVQRASVSLSLVAWASAAMGLVSVVLTGLRQRWTELGLRRAVGARPRDILLLLLREHLVLLFYGAAIGAVLGLAEVRALDAFVAGVEAQTSILCYAASVGSLAVTLGMSIWLPTRRIEGVSPRRMLEAD